MDIAIPPLFVCRADWTRAEEYPPAQYDGQGFGWEFLRRFGTYSAEYAALQTRLNSDLDESVDDLIDEFCLRWSIDRPVDPATTWKSEHTARRPQIGIPRPQIAPRFLGSMGLTDDGGYETSVRKMVTTRRHMLVRLSLDAPLAEQWSNVKKEFAAIKARETEEKRQHASFMANRALNGKPDGRASKHLHFILRTLDAMASTRPNLRDELLDEIQFFRKLPPNEAPIPAFGPEASTWIHPLAKVLAQQFMADSEMGKFAGGVDDIRPAIVINWMRSAHYFAAEKGYIRIATGRIPA